MLNFRFSVLRILVLTLISGLVFSCEDIDDYDEVSSEGYDSYPIKVYVETPQKMHGARSRFTVEQMNRLTDLNILVYHGGKLLDVHSGYYDDLSSLMLSFPTGVDGFNIYILGNVGKVEAPQDERSVSKISHVVGSYDEFYDRGVPVAGKFEDYKRGTLAEFPLKRLVGQFDIRMKVSADKADYLIKDVRIMNCARDVYPFSEGVPATIFTSSFQYDQDASGDLLTQEDVDALNAGQSVSLYFVENLQGELLPGNTDPKSKIPSALSVGLSDHCTYIEITADVTTPAAKYKDCRYRFYPGRNETTDFSIVRNTLYEVLLDFTQNMVSEEEWRIEADAPEVPAVFFSKDQVSVSPYGNDTIYVYSKSCDIRQTLDMKAVSFTDNYNKKHLKVDRSVSEYNGYYAYRFVVAASEQYDGLPVACPYGEVPEPKSVTYGFISSTELYNGNPLVSREITVNFYNGTYPLLLKLEKQPGAAIYQITLRGYNPLKRSITVSADYEYSGKSASVSPVTVTDISEEPSYLGRLNFNVTPENLTRIDFKVLIDGQPMEFDADCIASYGPDEDMYPARFDDMAEDGSMNISYWDNGWMPLFEGEKINVQYARCWYDNSLYLSNCIEESSGVIPGNGLNSRPVNGGDFYFLNGCLQIRDMYISYSSMVKYPNKAWRGADVNLWGSGRDLFFENATGTVVDGNHKMSFWITTWKNLVGKIKSQQESKYYSGQLYMTINNCSCWPGAEKSEYGYFTDAY